MGIARSSFYAWADAAEGRAARAVADQQLAERIRAVHAEHRSNWAYGAPRVTAELNDGTPAGILPPTGIRQPASTPL